MWPRPADAFFGRADELSQLSRWLRRSGDPRVLTVWGAGGIGKTRLVLEALHREIAAATLEPSAILYCAVEKARRPSDVFQAILDAADLGLLPGQTDTAQSVARRLVTWHGLLVILDGAETQAGAVGELLAAVLATHEGLRFLVTSQVGLGLKAEGLLPLGPLTPPKGESLAGTPAGLLFANRARRVRPGYQITPEDEPVVSRLLERLELNPLAIELAATRMGVLDARRILAHLEDSFGSLSTAAPDVPERHSSMHAVLDWTWSLLPEGAAAGAEARQRAVWELRSGGAPGGRLGAGAARR
jgi:non-specific serine/threonine protein kinase